MLLSSVIQDPSIVTVCDAVHLVYIDTNDFIIGEQEGVMHKMKEQDICGMQGTCDNLNILVQASK